MVCSRCGKENPADAQFCMRCGAPLAHRCLVCGADNSQDARFCLRCGAPLGLEGSQERRVVTVLFADLVGSTPLANRLDPETVRGLIAEYFAAMRSEVERYGGTVEKFIGDAVMAVFGLPTAHEDDPERALRAAAAMQKRMTRLNERLNADLHIRIGISTGEVVADPQAVPSREFMVTGEVVNQAARLQAQAPPDGILVDERTREATRLVAEYAAVEAPTTGDYPGLPRWRLERLAPPATARARAEGKHLRAPLVGRQDEMQVLFALYGRVVEDRKLHLVTIIGGAGMGKTRLTDEFLEALEKGTEPPHVLAGRCPAYGEGLTYWPLAEMLKQECAIRDSDRSETVSEKLRAGIMRVCAPVLGPDEAERIAASLASLLGVKVLQQYEAFWSDRLRALKQVAEAPRIGVREARGEADGMRALDDELARALRMFLVARAATAPLVLVFEDLHWAEESLLILMESLAVRAPDAPILILCMARPELFDRYPNWGRRIRNYVAVSLSPLSERQSTRLVSELLGSEAVPADVRDAILAKAEGNPFFIEEILRMLIDGGELVQDDGGWRCADPGRPLLIRIPDTIHGILASRLDLLSPLEKRVIQVASVAGRTFWLGGLSASGHFLEAEAAVALERLQERELVEERPVSSLAGEREFTFKHALIREVAYTTLPKAARSAAHLRFAQWLEHSAGQEDDEFLEVLAHHYEQAWRYRYETGDKAEDLARQAIDVMRRAGARARWLRTLPEARRLYERALNILRSAGLEREEELLIELLTDRDEIVKWLTEPTGVIEDTDIVIRLAPKLGREDLLARAWLNRALAEYQLNRLEPAEQTLDHGLQLFRKMGDRQGEAEALEHLGAIIEDLRGKPSRAQKAYHAAYDIYREMGHGQGMARTVTWLAWTYLTLGQLEEARVRFTEALRLAQQHHERIGEVNAQAGLAVVAHLTGDEAEARRRYEQTLSLRQEIGDPLSEANTRRGYAMHLLRYAHLDEAERELRTAQAIRRQAGKGENPTILRALAELYLTRGDILAAADFAEQALAAVREEDSIAMATHSATLGWIRAVQGRADEARALFRRALEILEPREYRIDLALTLLRYGEALLALTDEEHAVSVLERTRAMFSEMGAKKFVDVVDERLASLKAGAQVRA